MEFEFTKYVVLFLIHSYPLQYAHFKEEMYLQAQRAFGINPDRHYRLLHAAAEEKPKIIVLSVIVLEAEGLEAKDANGTYTFCFLFILFVGWLFPFSIPFPS